ncbi:MAG TPA: methyltransferase [Actinomycetota bacterium]|nr:methyltransferase [Actinomycetota bacterium]
MAATTTEPATEPGTRAPHEVIWGLAQAVVPSRALHVVAEVGVADHLGDEALPAAALAGPCQVDAMALERLLRLLCAHGIFECAGEGFRHNRVSRLLCSDHPRSMRSFARINGLPVARAAIAALDHAAATGRPGAECVDPAGFFHYLEGHAEEAAVFGQAMADKARADIDDLLAAYDFRPFGTIADIAGGRGHLLHAILAVAPEARGVLFDLPEVVGGAGPHPERLRTQAGDFFHDPLPAADLYLLMEVLHDWRDREAAAILGAIRRAAQPGATMLIIEHLLPDEGVDLVSQTLDVLMLAVTGGQERRPSDLRALLRSTGFQPGRVIHTAGPISAVEAVAI